MEQVTQAAGTTVQGPDLVALEEAHTGRRDVGQVGSRELDEPHELAPRGWSGVDQAGGDPLPFIERIGGRSMAWTGRGRSPPGEVDSGSAGSSQQNCSSGPIEFADYHEAW